MQFPGMRRGGVHFLLSAAVFALLPGLVQAGEPPAVCPSGDFAAFLRAYAHDPALQRAFVAPEVDLLRLAPTAEGIGPVTTKARGDGLGYPLFDARGLESDQVQSWVDGQSAEVIDKRQGLNAIKAYRFREQGCWTLTTVEDWSYEPQARDLAQQLGNTPEEKRCAARAEVFTGLGAREEYLPTRELFEAGIENYVCAAASGDPVLSRRAAGLSMSQMAPYLGFARTEALFMAAAKADPEEWISLAYFYCEGSSLIASERPCQAPDKARAALTKAAQLAGKPGADALAEWLAKHGSQQDSTVLPMHLTGKRDDERLVIADAGNQVKTLTAYYANSDYVEEALDAFKALPAIASTSNPGRFDGFDVAVVQPRRGALTVSGVEGKPHAVRLNMTLRGDVIVLSTREASNDSFNYNLIFGYTPKREDIQLFGVLLNTNRYQCGQTFTSTYFVESALALHQRLKDFDGTRAFHDLKAAYPQLQAANEPFKVLPVDLEQSATAALASYRKGDLAGLERQLGALGIIGGEANCDLERYVVERFFYADRLGWSNDLAFLFAEAGHFEQARILLERVVAADPQRIVAHLNLADSYWGLGDQDKARQSYRRYRELMVADGKALRIPPRVAERAGT
ncbi:hypothetical protein JYG34_16470 [Pseudomonas entomophila]|uniref:tetratricopeptide repeat protein n=1 Tax=Pseudomonas entomophila TaxID=312306 RepID=UPI001BCD1338|nr:bacterial transcriptional activator domain-containing protein [Pseudomonas entomophila]QVM89615.1 hypothetical protein JYG34_16470 [Pseudomonas entomophila]